MSLEAGLAEEFLFRAALQSRIAAWLKSPVVAILLVSIIFALAHWPGLYFRGTPETDGYSTDPIQVAAFTIATLSPLSILFGVIWQRTRSLLLVVLLHGAVNALPFTAVVEMTTMIPPAWIGGHTLVYLPRYLAPDDPMFEATDAEISSVFLAGLRRIHPRAADEVLAVRIARSREVFPLPTLNYSTTVPPVHTGVPGISFVSSAQICNGTLNVNETVARAEDALAELGVAGFADATP